MTSSRDSIRFVLENNILSTTTRGDDSEKFEYYIFSVKEEVINNITHTVLTSNEDDVFYIVDNQFHRENDLPAITCKRQNIMQEKEILCKMWMVRGKYHRENDKPAVIWETNDLLWMIQGKFKRNPFENISVHLPSEGFSFCYDAKEAQMESALSEKIKEQQEKGLLKYTYVNCG